MLRNVIAVIIGIIAGLAAYMGTFILLDGLSGKPAEGVELFFRFIQGQIPADVIFLLFFMGGFVVVPLVSFCGARVAARLGSSRPMLLAMIVGIISLVAGAVMQVDIMAFEYIGYGGTLSFLAILSTLLQLGAAWLAGFIEQKRRAAVDTPTPAFAETAKAE